jgi:CO dehydrogenase/acetyl-CoA synthase delta subunit
MPRLTCLEEKSYESKIGEWELYKAGIDIAKSMRGVRHDHVSLDGQKSIKDFKYDSTRVRCSFKVITLYHRPMKVSNSDKIVKDNFKSVLTIYILAPS